MNCKCLIASVMVLFSVVLTSHSKNSVASHTFDSTLQGWYSSNNWATVAHQTTPAGNPGGWMETTWTNLASYSPFDPWASDLFVTDATNLFTGTWDTNMWFELDFWAATNTPAGVQLEWGSTNSSRIWKSSMYDDGTDSMDAATWTTLSSASLLDASDWHPFWTQSQFLDDLASIDWVGVSITRPGSDGEIYGIDNFNLMVPEPAEMLLLLCAGICSWMTLRRKKGAVRLEIVG
jgi:hypothetical protein